MWIFAWSMGMPNSLGNFAWGFRILYGILHGDPNSLFDGGYQKHWRGSIISRGFDSGVPNSRGCRIPYDWNTRVLTTLLVSNCCSENETISNIYTVCQLKLRNVLARASDSNVKPSLLSCFTQPVVSSGPEIFVILDDVICRLFSTLLGGWKRHLHDALSHQLWSSRPRAFLKLWFGIPLRLIIVM